MKELEISQIQINPHKISGKGVLATVRVTLNQALVLDGIQLYRTTQGIQLRTPKKQNWPMIEFFSEMFKKTLLQKIWQSYYRMAQEAV